MSGDDVRDIETASLRCLEGCMTQETFLFSDTLRGNIAVAKEGASSLEIERAAHAAALDDLIDRLPQGLDTPLDQVAGGVSDGERQRIGLARVFLHDAPFALLDEPTSNLDCLNEAAVLQALAAEYADRTVVIVSHRLSGAAIADRTIVVEGGRLS